MKYLLGIVSLLAVLATANFAIADVVVSEIPIGAAPGDQDPQICVYDRTVTITPGDYYDGDNIDWSATGLGADAPTINVLNLRPGQYAFTGEQIRYDIVVRDPNGALDIGHAFLRVDEGPEVICNEQSLPETCDALRITGANTPYENGYEWFSGQPGETDERTDVAFHCIYTVEPLPEDTYTLDIGVRNANGGLTTSLYSERWDFNPAISLSVTTSDGNPLGFENGQPGETVHSLNRIVVKNTANSGVNLWMFIASSDLFDPSGASKCPTTNKLDVEGSSGDFSTGLYFRAVSGTLFTDLDLQYNDDYTLASQHWYHITNPNQNLACTWKSIYDDGTCTGARPLLSDQFLEPGYNALPDTLNGWAFNALTNGGSAEVEFKLKYPVPCIGSFSSGVLSIFGKPI